MSVCYSFLKYVCVAAIFFASTSSMAQTVSLTLTTDPEHGTYCSGSEGVQLIAGDLVIGPEYMLQDLDAGNWVDLLPFIADNTDYSIPGSYTAGAYRIVQLDLNGDIADMSNTVSVNERPLPDLYTVVNLTPGTNCIPVSPGLQNSQTGVTYYLYWGGSLIDDHSGNDDNPIDFGPQDEAGIYTIWAGYDDDPECLIQMQGSLQAYPLPVETQITPAGSFCTNIPIDITFKNTASNVTYTILNPDDEVAFDFPGTGSDVVYLHNFSDAGAYQVIANTDTGCELIFDRELDAQSTPQKFPMEQADACPGSEIILNGCEPDVDYYLDFTPLAGIDPSLMEERSNGPLICNGGIVNFGPRNLPGTYRIFAINQTTGCETYMIGETTIHPQPVRYNLTPDLAEACVDNVNHIGLDNSQSNVEYSLIRNGAVVATETGDGNPIQFSFTPVHGTYEILAELGECERWMNGDITLFNPPVTFQLTVDDDPISGHALFCDQGVTIGLDGSENGVEYELRRAGTQIGSFTGDGSPFNFTGSFSQTGTYVIVAKRVGCSTTMEGSITISSGPVEYALTASDLSFCEDDDDHPILFTLSGSQPGVQYSFQKDGVEVDAAAGNGSPIEWSITSALGAGDYTVEAQFINDDRCPVVSGPATISELPQPEVEVTGTSIDVCKGECTTLNLSYTGNKLLEVEYTDGSNTFVEVLDPVNGPMFEIDICPTPGTEYYEVVLAQYTDDSSCNATITGTNPIPVNVNDNPAVFTFESQDGNTCAPVTPILEGSELGVSYTIFRDGPVDTSPIQGPVAGTGNAIIFNPITTPGNYFVTASNNDSNCSTDMPDELIVQALPTQYSLTETNNVCITNDFSISLNGSQENVRYTLLRNGSPYNNLFIDDPDPVIFDGLNEAGVYEVSAENLETGCQRMMEGSREAFPEPQAYLLTVNGAVPQNPLYCVDADIGLNNSETGVTYRLRHNGETIQSLEGDGAPITFNPATAAGQYFITAHRAGCATEMTGQVAIADQPQSFAVSASHTSFCDPASAAVMLSHDSQEMVVYDLFLDGAATPANSQSGNGSVLIWENVAQYGEGEYTVRARFVTDPSGDCAYTSDPVTISEIGFPVVTMSLENSDPICAGSCTNLLIEYTGTEMVEITINTGTEFIDITLNPGEGPDYQIPVCPNETTTYILESARFIDLPGCEISFPDPDNVVVQVLDLPQAFTLSAFDDNYCRPVIPVLSSSETGVTYYLYREGSSSPVDSQTGDGSALEFAEVTVAGVYFVEAVNDLNTECSSLMENSIQVYPLPQLFNLRNTSDACAENGFSVGLSGFVSQENIRYHLQRNGSFYNDLWIDGQGEILFENLDEPGIYTILAENLNTGCQRLMSGSRTALPAPVEFALTANGNVPSNHLLYCTGTDIGLNNSETGVTYRLRRNGAPTGEEANGDTGNPIVFNNVSITGEYTITAHRAGCSTEMTGSVILSNGPVPVTLSASQTSYCEGFEEQVIFSHNSQQSVRYTLLFEGAPVGPPKPGTGSDITWENAASNGAGAYSVSARFFTDTDDSCPINSNTVMIETLSSPDISIFTNVTDPVCQNECVEIGFTYTGDQLLTLIYTDGTENFQILLDPNDSDDGTFTTTACPQQTATYFLVSAWYETGPECSFSLTSEPGVEIEVLENPQVFNLSSLEETSCAPVTPRLSGSETAVDYSLFRGDILVETIAGTGNPLLFEAVSSQGTYIVEATKGSCTSQMNNELHVSPLPQNYQIEPTGTICAYPAFDVSLSNSQAGIRYILFRNNSETDLSVDVSSDGDPVVFEGLSNSGTYRIRAQNLLSGCERWMTGELIVNPSPQPFTLRPFEQCSPVTFYLNESQANVAYDLYHFDDKVAEVFSEDTGVLYFPEMHDAGQYKVIATNEFLCEREMNNHATMLSLPEIYDVVTFIDDGDKGNFCLDDDLTIGLSDSDINIDYEMHRMGSDTNPIETVTGTGESFIFTESPAVPGTYRVKAINTLTGCSSWMNGEVKLNPLPIQYELISWEETDDICPPLILGFETSQISIIYSLYHDGDLLETKDGTGLQLEFNMVFEPGTYTAMAFNPVTGCETSMIGEQVLLEGPEHLPLLLEDNNHFFCDNDHAGNLLYIDESEEEVNYLLHKLNIEGVFEPVEGSAVQLGDGGKLEWEDIGLFGEGIYTVFGWDASENPDCRVPMANEYLIQKLEPLTIGFEGNPDDIELCLEAPLVIELAFTGNLPFRFEYTINGEEYDYTINPSNNSSPYLWEIPNLDEEMFITLGDVNYILQPFCSGDIIGSSQIQVSLTLPPVAELEPQMEFCGLPEVILDPMYAFTDEIPQWELVTGHGVLTNTNSFNPTYIPDPDDYISPVIIKLTVSGDGACAYVTIETETELLFFLPPEVDAGEDAWVCCDDSEVDLNGLLSGSATSASWASTHDVPGTFYPSADALDAVYTPSPEEIEQGVAVLILTSNDPDGPCTPATDEMTIIIDHQVMVNAGDNRNVCAGTWIQLEGEITGITTEGVWSGGNGTFDPDSAALNALYFPSQGEINMGEVTLVLSSLDPEGPCAPTDDSVTFTIEPAAVSKAGKNRILLAEDSVHFDDAYINFFSKFEWRILGNHHGAFENIGTLTPTYYSHIQDAGSSIFLRLDVWGQESCINEVSSDTLEIKVGTPVIADFYAVENRPDTVLCMGLPAYFRDISHFGEFDPHHDQYISAVLWDFGDGSTQTVINPDGYYQHIFDDHGTFEVSLSVETMIEDVIIYTNTVIYYEDIRDCFTNSLVFPNALAPDNPNPEVSTFKPKGINLRSYHLRIYDLKGNLVWETNEIDNFDGSPMQAWDGHFQNGKPAPQGVYIWRVDAEFLDGRRFGHSAEDQNHGTITLIR